MQKNENSDQKSHPKDITQCYGNDCEECRESCRWKEAGRSRMADDRHDHNVKAGTTKVFDFKEKLGSIVFTSGGTEAGNALRLFYWALKVAPRGTMAILERAFEGKNQTDAARKRGVSRQAISKLYKGDLQTLAKLLGIRQPNLPESRLWKLSPFEFQILQFIHLFPGISERAIARQLGKTQSAVHRAKVSALRKMNHNFPSKRPAKRITKKSA